MSGECDKCGEHCLDCKCIQEDPIVHYKYSVVSQIRSDYHILNKLRWTEIEEMVRRLGQEDANP